MVNEVRVRSNHFCYASKQSLRIHLRYSGGRAKAREGTRPPGPQAQTQNRYFARA
jgi:hypothetical protein